MATATKTTSTSKKTTKKSTRTSKPAVSKTKRILAYLEKNPGHTWSDAKSKLGKYGISNTYFSMIKSKNNGKSSGSPAKKVRDGSKANGSMKSGNVKQLQKAAEFAKSVGGIENAKAALLQLEQFQVS